MTCKDCLHADVCYMVEHYGVDLTEDGQEYDCNQFKDKSRFVELPCKVGDVVYFVGTSNTNRLKAGVIETTVEKIVLKSGGIYMKLSCNAMYETSCRSIGKTVFLTREAAEAAIKEKKNAPD